MIYLNLIYLFSIVQLISTDSWSSTTTNCLWHEYTSNDRLSKRIDLRDIRNQVLA